MKTFVRNFVLYFLIVAMPISSYADTAAENPDVKAYMHELVKKYNFNEQTLQQLFSTLTINEEVISRVSKPYEAKPWYQYRELFITADRINKGVAYWQAHEKTLDLAEKKYGVPANVMVAIIGVETKYGENKGKFPVFNTLATLAFNHNRRCEFFKSELTEYLLLARDNGFKPLTLTGSYAGAVGLPQFMPSSYRHYAVDFYHKGYADLFNNHADAIGSVGNYLHKHGWKSGSIVAIPASIDDNMITTSSQKKFRPHLTAEDLVKYKITPAQPLNGEKACFISLENENGYEHWLGLQNFYVISTYNSSELYVMAVNELSEKIKEKKLQTPKIVQNSD